MDIPKQILDAAHFGKLVVFVGAGASRLVGGNSWAGYANNKLAYLQEKKYISFYEKEKLSSLPPRKILSICDIIMQEHDDVVDSEERFLIGTKDEACSIYRDLYKFKAIYITTNYDDFLDRIAEETISEVKTDISNNQRQRKVFFLDDDFTEAKLLEPGNVLHIHGGMKQKELPIVTIWDYLRQYASGSNLADLLKIVFQKYCVLFVGYGLEELEILEYIVNIAERGEDIKEIRHYLLYPTFHSEKNMMEFYRKYYHHLGIDLLSYELDQNGYKELADVVACLAEAIEPRAGSGGLAEKLKLFDGVDL